MKKMNKLMKNLDPISDNEEENAINFLTRNGQDLAEEIKLFREDYSKFRTGVFLWIKDKYPIFLEFLSIIAKQKFSFGINVLDKMELVIGDYFSFIEDVKISSQNLFRQEKLESKKLVFEKTTKPINILCKKNALLGYLSNELEENTRSCMEPFVSLIQKNIPVIQQFSESYYKEILPILGDSFELMSKILKGDINQEQFQKILNEQEKKAKETELNFKRKSELIASKIKEERQFVQKETKEFLDKVVDSSTILKEAYSQDPTKIIYEYLLMTKDIDSFNIKFTKFLNRMFHILSFNNRNYKIHYQIGKYNNQEREKLKNFLSKNLKIKYSNLANFLLECYKYNKFRRLEAHEIPDKIKLSPNRKTAYISKTGDVPDIEMDIEKIQRIINSYGFFIDAIDI